MAKKLTQEITLQIKKFRSEGWSLNELKKYFNLGSGTVSRYSKGIQILPKYQSIWLNKRKSSIERKIKAESEAKNKASNLVKSLSPKEKLLILASLYWAEGTKVDLSLTNSDPRMIKLFIEGVTKYLVIPLERIKINIRIFEDMDQNKCIDYWLKTTNLSRDQISSINVLKGKKLGKLEFGICRARVLKGADMLKYLKAIKEEILTHY